MKSNCCKAPSTKMAQKIVGEMGVRNFIRQEVKQAKVEVLEKVEEELRICYKNGVIDGKQNTDFCEDVVVAESKKRLLAKLKKGI